MNIKKVMALLVCLALLTAVFAGCKQTAKTPFVSSDPVATATPSGDAASPSAAALNFAGAYASLDPKTVMLTINGKDVTWDELYFYIFYFVNYIQSQGVQISDWSSEISDKTNYKDFVLTSSVNQALQDGAYQYGAEQLKVTLTDEDKAAIQTDWDSKVTSAGSEEAFLAKLKEQYCTKELYMTLSQVQALAQKCFVTLYGESAAKLTDEEVADNTAEDGYMMAKHILFSTAITDDEGNRTTMPDDQKAKVKEKAEAVLADLKKYKGDDFNGYFDELMKANTEDAGGLASFPNGYLFQSGDMVKAFEDATKALEIGKMDQELVESEFGYHIIYRLPINYDTTPIGNSSSSNDSLRVITAQNMFSAVSDTWVKSLNVVYSEAYKALDFNKMFAAG